MARRGLHNNVPLIYTSPLQVLGLTIPKGGGLPSTLSAYRAQECTGLVGGTVTVVTVMVHMCKTHKHSMQH